MPLCQVQQTSFKINGCCFKNDNENQNIFLEKIYLFVFMSLGVLAVCMSVYPMHACYLQRPEEGVRWAGTEVMVGCEPPWGDWGLTKPRYS